MANMELHCGRLLDHVQLAVGDLAASRRFCDAVFAALAIPLGENRSVAYVKFGSGAPMSV